jgi:hypothetical protein
MEEKTTLVCAEVRKYVGRKDFLIDTRRTFVALDKLLTCNGTLLDGKGVGIYDRLIFFQLTTSILTGYAVLDRRSSHISMTDNIGSGAY